jgi:hypothetical protein
LRIIFSALLDPGKPGIRLSHPAGGGAQSPTDPRGQLEQNGAGALPIWAPACAAALVTGNLLAARIPIGIVQAGR